MDKEKLKEHRKLSHNQSDAIYELLGYISIYIADEEKKERMESIIKDGITRQIEKISSDKFDPEELYNYRMRLFNLIKESKINP